MEKQLPYSCENVFELAATESSRVDQLEALEKCLNGQGIKSEIYYTNHENIDYATLVIFLPKDMLPQLSDFDPNAFKIWHQ